MDFNLNDLLHKRMLINKKYNTINKLFLILSLVLLNIGFVGYINSKFNIIYICESILLLEFIIFSVLAFFFRKNDTKIINCLEERKIELNIEDLNILLLKCSKKRNLLDVLGNIIIIIAILIFICGLLIKIYTAIDVFFIIKNINLILFSTMSFMEWKYSKLLDKTISTLNYCNM